MLKCKCGEPVGSVFTYRVINDSDNKVLSSIFCHWCKLRVEAFGKDFKESFENVLKQLEEK
jgi:hypothetical protein